MNFLDDFENISKLVCSLPHYNSILLAKQFFFLFNLLKNGNQIDNLSVNIEKQKKNNK